VGVTTKVTVPHFGVPVATVVQVPDTSDCNEIVALEGHATAQAVSLTEEPAVTQLRDERRTTFCQTKHLLVE
jgi:hypothetical protein